MKEPHVHINDDSPFVKERGKHLTYQELIEGLLDEKVRTRKLVVRECDKCGHDTLQQERSTWKQELGTRQEGFGGPYIKTKELYYCLNCGTLYEIVEKSEAKEVT